MVLDESGFWMNLRSTPGWGPGLRGLNLGPVGLVHALGRTRPGLTQSGPTRPLPTGVNWPKRENWPKGEYWPREEKLAKRRKLVKRRKMVKRGIGQKRNWPKEELAHRELAKRRHCQASPPTPPLIFVSAFLREGKGGVQNTNEL